VTAPAAPLPAPGFRIAVDRRRHLRVGWRSWAVLAITVIAAFFLLIWSRIALDHNAFVLQEMERQTGVEESRYWELRLEAARLQAPERIIDAATEMGMVYPETVHTVEVAGLGSDVSPTEERWVDLKQVLGARP
jgi:hypothetical protein